MFLQDYVCYNRQFKMKIQKEISYSFQQAGTRPRQAHESQQSIRFSKAEILQLESLEDNFQLRIALRMTRNSSRLNLQGLHYILCFNIYLVSTILLICFPSL